MSVAYSERDHAGYVPLDEWLEKPATRAARALKHFDWVTFDELAQALDLPEGCRSPERMALAQALVRLEKSGHVAREGERGSSRFRLLRELEPPKLPEPLPHDGDERPGEFFWRGKWRKNGERL